MARIRTVKPEFFTSEQVADCSPTARLLFIGMWCFCDDGGVHPASVKRLKMEVFPADSMNEKQIIGYVDELIKSELLTEFVGDDGKSYWQVTGWHHQKIEKPTFRHPQKSSDSPTIRRPFADHSPTEGNGRESKGKEGELNGKDKAPSVVVLPDWVPVKEWNDWVAIRPSKSNKPETLQKNIEKLDAWRKKGHSVKEILDYSIAGGYQGLFEPKPNSYDKPSQAKQDDIYRGVKL